MEQRPSRGRGGNWRRGGGGESHQSSGEQRGRGRGGHHRGRGRRDHYRGRGRAGPAADHRQVRDESDTQDPEDTETETFSRRKLESNWDRYEAEEKDKSQDEGPTQRGTDYHVLLGSAGDSFTQFRFTEEKEWEAESSAVNQVSALLVDLQALAQSLQGLPVHLRLNLEAEIMQAATPVELPAATLKPKLDSNCIGQFRTPPAQPPQGPAGSLGVSCPVKPVLGTAGGETVENKAPSVSCDKSSAPADELDSELDLLLTLQTDGVDQSQCAQTPENDTDIPDTVTPVEAEAVAPEMEVVMEKEEVPTPEEVQADGKRQEVTEEDLEDWLDSMIS